MERSPTIQELALELYSCLASRFPICCASDEFVFFPQAVSDSVDWSLWDDLSAASVEETVSRLKQFRENAAKIPVSGSQASGADRSLVALLLWVTLTLEEQFTLVKTHSTQPTFALTVATVGLVQALQSGEEGAWSQRVQTLPGFMDSAFSSLTAVPALYRTLGIEMADMMTRWLPAIAPDSQPVGVLVAIANYRDRLARMAVVDDFHLPRDDLERVVMRHTGSGLSISDTLEELQDEISLVSGQLLEEAGKLGCAGAWESCYRAIVGDPLPVQGRKGLLSLEISRLKEHCRHLGFLAHSGPDSCDISIEDLPDSLAPVRAADSYNAIPGHPFRGGVFYIFGDGSLGTSGGSVHPVYRMTAAHESFPGHHLLDLSRWNNPEAALRPVEYPLFYEGWACFGEDLMLGTEAFDRPYDRLILLRRRYRHAVRGKVDLLLHSGILGLREAAGELMTAGFPDNRALETVRKYALRPAYQMCYTIGRRRFQRLFDFYGQVDSARFVKKVLSGGEILFEDLERVLKNPGGGERESGGGEVRARNGETGKRGNGE